MSTPARALPEWEDVLSAAARLQRILPDAVLVGGTASAVHAAHRFSRDADRQNWACGRRPSAGMKGSTPHTKGVKK